MCLKEPLLVWLSLVLSRGSGRRPDASGKRTARGDRRRPERRGNPERDGDGDQSGTDTARDCASGDVRGWRRDVRAAGDGRYMIQARVHGIRDGHSARRPAAERRHAPIDHAADQEGRRRRHRRPRSADVGARSARQRVLDRAHARADRRAAGRSRRDGADAEGDGASGIVDSRGRVHRRQAAAQVADPIDPAAAPGHVRGAEPRRPAGDDVHRHHDAAGQRAAARVGGSHACATTR